MKTYLFIKFKILYAQKRINKLYEKYIQISKYQGISILFNNFLKTDTGKISRKTVSESIEELKKKQIKVFDNIIPPNF
ncbi:hypothetical protein PFDG_04622 [Plasmodium falciparum Dd2]|uniref:Uncharacterized protein n=1 Tax=Plasmodium falciparum (isolate Dd2) TaxID=57267 RepID=A0A0L7M5K4_PLAF4|nr:hypothetical protein PFDG_04622 [Plasmodium falciparum Dd2]